MKLIKTLPAVFAIVLLAGCATQEETTGAEGAKEGSCCKGTGEASCCDGAKVEKADGKGADGTPLKQN